MDSSGNKHYWNSACNTLAPSGSTYGDDVGDGGDDGGDRLCITLQEDGDYRNRRCSNNDCDSCDYYAFCEFLPSQGASFS